MCISYFIFSVPDELICVVLYNHKIHFPYLLVKFSCTDQKNYYFATLIQSRGELYMGSAQVSGLFSHSSYSSETAACVLNYSFFF